MSRVSAPREAGAGSRQGRVMKRIAWVSARDLSTPLHARVDPIGSDDGSPWLLELELELTEPSLFFAQAPGAAGRLARHLCSH